MIPSQHELDTFRERLLVWFAVHGRAVPWRRRSVRTYEKVLTEVFLQRTTVSAVSAFVPRFVKRYPSWAAIAALTETELGEELRPLGLWKRRAATLLPLAREMARRRGRFPRSRTEIESLPGVGQYIANSILLLCHGGAEPLLDVNMARVLERYFGPRKRADIRHDPYLQELSRRVVASGDPRVVNWAILDFAALVCKARRPLCELCPISPGCRFAQEEHRGVHSSGSPPGPPQKLSHTQG